MKPEFQKNNKVIQPAPAAKQSHEVSRALFTLPSATWTAIDLQRKGTGLTAAQWVTSLVLKAGKQ